MNQPRMRRPNGARHDTARSVRINDEVWEQAKRRAKYEGLTISRVIYLFVEGYAKDKVDAPRTEVVYSPARPVDEVAS